MSKNKMGIKKFLDKLYLAAFLLPVLIMLVIFIARKIFPFG